MTVYPPQKLSVSLAGLLLLGGCVEPPPAPTPSAIFEDLAEPFGLYYPGGLATSGGRGAAVGDINNDGFPDLFLAGTWHHSGGRGRLFLNRSGEAFEEVTAEWGLDWDQLPPVQLASPSFADLDNDGDQDLLLGTYGSELVLRNDGGYFTNISAESGVVDLVAWSTGMALADYNADGKLDLFVTRYEYLPSSGIDNSSAPRDLLLEGQGDGTFIDRTSWLPLPELGGASWGGGWSDVDKDGDPDLYVVHDHGGQWTPNQLFRNDGAGEDGWLFTRATEDCGCDIAEATMGLAIGDYDGDLDLDFFVTNLAKDGGEVLLQNQGDGGFVDVSLVTGASVGDVEERQSSWGAEFLDFDNDGWPDVFVGFGGDPTGVGNLAAPSTNLLLRNRQGVFERVTDPGLEQRSGNSLGLAKLDFNLDGCLDLLVVNLPQQPELLRNTCDGDGQWIGFRLEGVQSNRDAVGARVQISAAGRLQEDELHAGTTSHSSGSWKVLHFGLGEDVLEAERVEVRWPSGLVEVHEALPSGVYYLLTEGGGVVPL